MIFQCFSLHDSTNNSNNSKNTIHENISCNDKNAPNTEFLENQKNSFPEATVFSIPLLLCVDFLDHFDLYLYIALGPILGHFFFSSASPLSNWLKVYSLFWGASVLAYPLGALVFSWIAQHYRAEKALIYSITGFSVCTILMGCLPGYATCGVWSSFFLVIIRILQCFFARGERVIARFYIMNRCEPEHALHRLVLYEIGTLLGLFCASFLAIKLLQLNENMKRHDVLMEFCWRTLFIIAGLAGLYILKMRKKSFTYFMPKTDARNISENSLRFSLLLPLQEYSVFFWIKWWGQIKKIIQEIAKNSLLWWATVIMVSGFSYIPYALAFQFLNSFVPHVTSLHASSLMINNSIFFIVDILFLALLAFGLQYYWRAWNNKNSPNRVNLNSFNMKIFNFLPEEKIIDYSESFHKKFEEKSKENTTPNFLAQEVPFFSHLLKWIALIWAFIIIPLFSGLAFWPSLFYVSIIRFIIVFSGVLYALAFGLWLKGLQPTIHSYLSIGIASSVGVVLMGQSCGLLCFSLYKYIPYVGIAGLYPCVIALSVALLLRVFLKKELIQTIFLK